jgi:aspartokinase
LANGEGINTVVNIENKARRKIAIVVSARGKATDEDDILTIAAKTEITNHFREF